MLDIFSHILRNEQLLGLWKGCAPVNIVLDPSFFFTVFIEYFRNFKIKPFDFGLDNFGIVFTNSIFSILQYFENLIRLLTSFFTTQFVIDQVFSILTLYST